MNRKLKKLVSLLSSSLLVAAGVVGITALPANAVAAPSPALLVNYESETLVTAPWNSLPGYNFSEAQDQGWGGTIHCCDGWTNYVGNSEKPGGSLGSLKMLKATMGGGTYHGAFIVKLNSGNSLLGANSRIITMNFNSPAAGKVVDLHLESGDYPPAQAFYVSANQRTILGWQTLTFDFSNVNPNFNIALDRAWINYDPSGTTQSPAFFVDDVSFNGATAAAVSPGLNLDVRLTSSQKNTSLDAYQWNSCGGQSWCANNNYFMKMFPAQSSQTVTYVVSNRADSSLVAGATVWLRMNTAYSGSNATWSSGGSSFAAVGSSNQYDAGYISGTTNSSGEVSFTFTNTNTSGEVSRVLNSANPYPSGCFSPEGQTKASLQPTVVGLSSGNIGDQFVDVLWPHISSTTINTSIGRGSDGADCNARVIVGNQKNKGEYPHLRLEGSFLDTYFDASWWDGVWQNRDADTQAFLKYVPVGSTFKLTYVVTGNDNLPLADAPVTLIVNANYSCAKTFFLYENTLIGPDDCSGGGQTELPAKKTDSQGRVSFVLTNTNTVGEAMPLDLNGLPNGKVEVGTNIKPHLVGATKEGIDMLFAHFVQPTEKANVSAPSAASVAAGGNAWSTFTFTDENGAAVANTEVAYMINGFDAKTGYAKTDASGKVLIRSSNPTTATGKQVVAVSLIRPGKLPLTGSAVVNWISPSVSMTASGAKGAVVVTVSSANGKSVKINVGGKIYARTATSDSASFTIPATAGAKKVVVTVGTKSVTKTVTVSK